MVNAKGIGEETDGAFLGRSKGPIPVRIVLLLLLASVAAIGFQAIITHPFDPNRECCDHLFYRSMAFNFFSIARPDLDHPPPGNRLWTLYPGSGPSRHISWLDLRNGLRRQPPYAYRVVTPLLARTIAFVTGDINIGFYLITFTSLVGAAFFLALSVYVGIWHPVPAVLAIAVFATSVPVTYNLWDYMLTDPMAFLLAGIAIFALIRRKPLLFFSACLVGVFNKEALVPMLVCYPLSEFLLDRRVRASSVLASLGIAGLWFLFRHLLPIPVARYSFISEFWGIGQTRAVIIAAGATFGFLAVASWRVLFAPVLIALLPFALAQVAVGWLFFANTKRVLVQALPFLIIAIFAAWPVASLTRLLVALPVAAQVVLAVWYNLAETRPYQFILPMLLIVVCSEVALVTRMHGSLAARWARHPHPP
jgi:hypothetical protein